MASRLFRDDAFAGQHVFVTGGTQGIGMGVAEAFARHAARVTVCSRKAENVAAARKRFESERLPVDAIALDVRDRAAVQEAADALWSKGPIDVVVNNAAGNFPSPFLELSENGWDAVLNIVLQGTANVCRSFGRAWAKAQRGGSVVNILAGYAWLGAPYLSHSGASKAAVMNLTRSLAAEWAPLGVRVNAVSPGPIADTGGTRMLMSQAGITQQVLARVPAARMGTREELANAVLFLASDAASYVTGAVLVVDGGMDANLWNVLPNAGPR